MTRSTLTLTAWRIKKAFVSHDQFPSGPWVGFYNYRPGDKHRMDLHLEFSSGCLKGEGNDDVGPFLIQGRYDTAQGECHWTKSYPGSHDVFYRGFREGKGIWGVWEIGNLAHGGFHIWPRGATGDEQESAAAEEATPAQAVAKDRELTIQRPSTSLNRRRLRPGRAFTP